MLRKRISVLVTSLAVVAGGLAFSAAPANAAVTGASISVTQWPVNSTTAVTVSWTQTNQVTTSMVRSPWPWVSNWAADATGFAATGATGTRGTQTITCTQSGVAIVFTFSDAKLTTGITQPTCKYANSNGADGFTGFWIDGNLTIFANSTVSVAIPSGQVAAPSSARRDTWIVGPYSSSWNSSEQAEIATVAVGPDGEVPQPPPTIRLDINGNGGVCTPSFVEGEQGTWGTTPTADKCTNGSRQLAFFSTSPTAALGATNVRPGGPVYFLTANLLYAIWAAERPSPVNDVVATSGLNSVKVTWKAPVSDGGDPINSYCIALRTEKNPNPFPRCSNAAQPLELTFNLPATNTKYTPTVFARNSAGSTEPVAGAPASPYDFREITASRPNVLLGLGGSRVEASGSAPGLAGKAVNAQFKVGSAKDWTTQANAATVNAQGQFNWSRKFGPSLNKQNVAVRFTYGADLVSGTYVLARGGQAGSLTAPRNIKVENVVNKVKVSWDKPKFDGGEKITGYILCAVPGRGGTTCRSETGTEGTFWNLNTRQSYTITVAAKTAQREGPAAKSSKTVDPTEASIRGVARSSDELTADVRGEGFKKNSRFRAEIASPIPGVNPDRWAWDEVTSFREERSSFRKTLSIPLDTNLRGERLMLRLFTPTGTVYSRSIRP